MLKHVLACAHTFTTCTRALPAKLSCLSRRRPPWHGIGKVPQWVATSPSNFLPHLTPSSLRLRLQYLEYCFSFCFCSIAIVGRINSLQTALKYHSRLSVCVCAGRANMHCCCYQIGCSYGNCNMRQGDAAAAALPFDVRSQHPTALCWAGLGYNSHSFIPTQRKYNSASQIHLRLEPKLVRVLLKHAKTQLKLLFYSPSSRDCFEVHFKKCFAVISCNNDISHVNRLECLWH